MFEFSSITAALWMLTEWNLLLMMVLGMLFGIITGAIPGFSTPLAISIMLPLTFSMSPLVSIVFLTAIYSGGNFGSAISAILLNIPGSPQAIMTGLDGYPMTRAGKANEALGIAVAASSIGNLIGCFFLIMVMPLIVIVALMFGPPEMFLVGVLGLTIIAALHRSFLKAMIAGMFGVLISTIGMSNTGAIRGTHGHFELMDGIPIIPALVGLIGFSELFFMLQNSFLTDQAIKVERSARATWSQLLTGFKRTFRHPGAIARSSGVGLLLGALPGAGATIASVVSYNEARRWTKHPEEFGKGSTEGLLAAESANSASEGGALALMLALGIPGGLATAVLIGALMLQGLIPGPRLFMDEPVLVYGVMLAQFQLAAMLLVLGLVVSFFAVRVVNIPTGYLIPTITVFSLVGTYAVNLLMFDVWLMLAFAALGIVLRRFDYPLIAVVLGIVLGPILDRQLLRTFQTFDEVSLKVFLDRPVSLVLIAILALSLLPMVLPLLRWLRARGSGSTSN